MQPLIPILLDVCPSFMAPDGSCGSLLQMPVGQGSLLDELIDAAQAVSRRPPLVYPTFEPATAYQRQIEADVRLAGPLLPDVLRDPLAKFVASDLLLFISPVAYPVAGLDLRDFLPAAGRDQRIARHLLVLEPSRLETKEFVHADGTGRVRSIQRYFADSAWPFSTGVAASLVSVTHLLRHHDLRVGSLGELRQRLAECGIPSQDVPFDGEVLDLSEEAGMLALQEARLGALASDRDRSGADRRDHVVVSAGATISHSAHLIGPIHVGRHAVIESDTLVVGPAIIGAGAVVHAGATVAQSLVMPHAVLPPGATLRHRVLAESTSGAGWDDRNGGVADYQLPQRRHEYVPPVVEQPHVERRPYLEVRNAVEPILAFLLLLVLSPLLLVLALAVKLTSRGPIFFGDWREGEGGRPFRCWKFRSMCIDADVQQSLLAAQQYADGPQFKMRRDPRITWIGGHLRSLNLDELPQLANIVAGQMSFVGPRPSPFRENQICVPWRLGRLSVRPGITGLWQVCRKDRDLGDFHQWIAYDLAYVKHVSFAVDLRIALATILTFGGRYPVALSRIIPAISDDGVLRESGEIASLPPSAPLRPSAPAPRRSEERITG